MKFVLVLPASDAAGWAAADSRALTEGHAGWAPAREARYRLSLPRYRAAIALDSHQEAYAGFAKVKEMAQEEQPAPLMKTPGRQEK